MNTAVANRNIVRRSTTTTSYGRRELVAILSVCPGVVSTRFGQPGQLRIRIRGGSTPASFPGTVGVRDLLELCGNSPRQLGNQGKTMIYFGYGAISNAAITNVVALHRLAGTPPQKRPFPDSWGASERFAVEIAGNAALLESLMINPTEFVQKDEKNRMLLQLYSFVLDLRQGAESGVAVSENGESANQPDCGPGREGRVRIDAPDIPDRVNGGFSVSNARPTCGSTLR